MALGVAFSASESSESESDSSLALLLTMQRDEERLASNSAFTARCFKADTAPEVVVVLLLLNEEV